MTLDHKGNVYGTTAGGGTGPCGGGCGAVFQLVPQPNGEWTENVLYSFLEGADDGGPYGNVILDGAGNIYGTTTVGPHYPGGTVFELTVSLGRWNETVLHAFCSKPNCDDGYVPVAGVTRDGHGSLFGTTGGGGINQGGVVFELTPDPDGWKESVIHSFYSSCCGHVAPGGSGPSAGLILDASGNLYGTTYDGGKGSGVIFELTSTPTGGWKEIVLHSFPSFRTDGQLPGWGALLMDSAGSLYGTTRQGGAYICYAGCGTVFKLTKGADGRWGEIILYNFRKGAGGFGPNAGVVMDKGGNLYGTTDYGGYGDCGVIYKLVPGLKDKWSYSVLHTFGTGYDGCLPEGNLVFDKNGNLYGGTVLGGKHGYGIVFEITP